MLNPLYLRESVDLFSQPFFAQAVRPALHRLPKADPLSNRRWQIFSCCILSGSVPASVYDHADSREICPVILKLARYGVFGGLGEAVQATLGKLTNPDSNYNQLLADAGALWRDIESV